MREMLVSCVMPTYGRREWVPLALRCWQEQTYPRRELIVVDDGPEPCCDLVESLRDSRIRYTHLGGRSSIGQKLNYGIRMARGEITALWADDDYHAPWRLTYQIKELLGSKAGLCGCDSIHYWDTERGEMWRYDFSPLTRSDDYVVGGTMLFWWQFWVERPFDVQPGSGEDWRFIMGRGPLLGTLDNTFYLGTIHGGNYSPKEHELRGYSPNWSRTVGGPLDLAPGWWVEGVRAIHECCRSTNARMPEAEAEVVR